MKTADRIRAAIGEPLLKAMAVYDFYGYEAADGVVFHFVGSPSGGDSFQILLNEETELCRVKLFRRKNSTTVQGKQGVALGQLSQVVRSLSRHGA